MSTALTVLVSGGAKPDWDALYAFAEAKEALFDHRLAESPVGRLSRGESLVPPAEVLAVLRTSLEIAALSGGAFDPTILPLTRLWSFDTGGRLPDPQEIRQAMTLVDYRRLAMPADARVSLPPGFGLDLGGIAKGAVVDLLAEQLEKRGSRNFLIEAGGDILVSGLKEGRKPWVIAIRHPRQSQKYAGLVSLGRQGGKIAIVTSGDYERYFMLGDKRYHHILDPHTGYPAQGLASVTVIAPTCSEADALATAAFVLGPDRGLALLERLENVEGLLISEREGKLSAVMTTGFPLPASELRLD